MSNDRVLHSLATLGAGNANPLSIRNDVLAEASGFRGNANSPNYTERLVEANEFMADCQRGQRRPRHWESFGVNLQEAMTTSDFQVLFGDVLDRELLARYESADRSWQSIARRRTVNDFREAKSFDIGGLGGALPKKKEDAEFEDAALEDAAAYKVKVEVFGENVPISFETQINNDIGALDRIPAELSDLAINTEQLAVTRLYSGAAGYNTNFFTSGNSNIMTGNPVLNFANLKAQLIAFMSQRDPSGKPIIIRNIKLVVPPALYWDATALVTAVQVEIGVSTDPQRLLANNPLRDMVEVVVDHYIPLVANTNADTSWFLIADPASSRPAFQIAFLRGFEQPGIYMKAANRLRLGGGDVDARMGDFETMATRYQVVHILGTGTVDPLMARASNGTGGGGGSGSGSGSGSGTG